MDALDKFVFNNDYLRYFHTRPNSFYVGVNGGEDEIEAKKKVSKTNYELLSSKYRVTLRESL